MAAGSSKPGTLGDLLVPLSIAFLRNDPGDSIFEA